MKLAFIATTLAGIMVFSTIATVRSVEQKVVAKIEKKLYGDTVYSHIKLTRQPVLTIDLE